MRNTYYLITIILSTAISFNLHGQTELKDLNPLRNVRPNKPPIFYLHGGAGFSMPGMLFSKEITNSLTEAVEGKWRIHHVDFPYSLSASTGLSNILRVEYTVSTSTFRHDIKYTGDILGYQSGPPYFVHTREEFKMKHRNKDLLFMINPIYNNWLKDISDADDGDNSTGSLFLIYGLGKMGYIDKSYDILSWRGRAKIYGIGISSITKTNGFSFQLKYYDITFKYAPLSVVSEEKYKASYFALQFNYYIGLGL